VTPPTGQQIHTRALAYKAYEIEELADIYFFRPLGAIVARAAAAVGLSPTQVTLIGAGVGVVAGAVLYDARLGLVGFALLLVHSVIDSADGQLARMTGRVTELGRILDGVGGYMTHAAIYIAIVAGFIGRGGSVSIIVLCVLSAIANITHAQLYDYFRTSYANIVIRGVPPRQRATTALGPWAAALLRVYEQAQQRLIGSHRVVEAAIASRAADGVVTDADRGRYRASFYWTVRGWNFLGDNTRIYTVGALAWIHHLEWFFAVVLVPMNVAMAALWWWQRRADRRFLDSAVVG
jgi:phosphatidylglycerophosphate synthase